MADDIFKESNYKELNYLKFIFSSKLEFSLLYDLVSFS
jgi:hypothetical protein